MAADQYENGSVPHVIPDAALTRPENVAAGAAGWGDAAVIIPWTLYLSYGDRRILEEQYPSMTALARVRTRAGRRRLHLGRRLPIRRLARLYRSAP